MSDYVSYTQIPQYWNLKDGDVVFISSDITNLFLSCKQSGEFFDANKFIDIIIDIIGPTGTLLFPTYNWDFCRGKVYDYNKATCKTGYLGSVALSRKDFKRTKHPIYSFAVTGNHKDYLCSLDNKSSFGYGSPFDYLYKIGAINIIIDVPYTDCFTYIHYVQEISGIRDCRYMKTFKSGYINEHGSYSIKEYDMLVRRLQLNVENHVEGMGKILECNGVSKIMYINGLKFNKVLMHDAFSFIMHDIKENKSRNLCTFIGQDDD